MYDERHLIIFTRFPEPGRTKTRLIPHLGENGAAHLQKEMTEYTVKQARKCGAKLEIRFTGGSHEQMRGWLGDDLSYVEQGEGNLGQRMESAFADHFSTGAKKVVLVGSDCPSNDYTNMRSAFHALEASDCVLGPARDGGYYLIGLAQPSDTTATQANPTSFPTRLFSDIDWDGKNVFEETLDAAAGLKVELLNPLVDVDTPEDIPPRITVVVPTLNEEEYLLQTLESVKSGFNVETIVADGGSSDGTRTIAKDYLTCSGGRARQQNAGAAAATGEVLLFLHADTQLPVGWDWIVRRTLSDPSVALGAFTFRIKERISGLGIIEKMANWRSRTLMLPYGDQGLFLRKKTFEEAGGFPVMPIMEDYVFVRSVRRYGLVVTVPEAAITSGRRWKEHGVFKTTFINILMVLGYHLGIAPDRLARMYREA